MFEDGAQSYLCRLLFGIAIHACADTGKGDACQLIFFCQFKCTVIAGGK